MLMTGLYIFHVFSFPTQLMTAVGSVSLQSVLSLVALGYEGNVWLLTCCCFFCLLVCIPFVMPFKKQGALGADLCLLRLPPPLLRAQEDRVDSAFVGSFSLRVAVRQIHKMTMSQCILNACNNP